MAHSSPSAQVLIVVSLLGVLGLGVWAWEVAGWGVFVVFGLPAVGAALALWAERASVTMRGPATVAAVGAMSVARGWVTLLAGGLYLLVPALLLLVAAVVSWVSRRPDLAIRPRR
ncbi:MULTISPECIES: hypothetical protein [unclassified Modestobacter]|uniref:hypothetical protein n=1 Tax=unclassified Modestobacter TaxID=2643866 RepID=UPI0022AA7A24|nr:MULTISPECIES: hypothetical protein [unclassified Modestobacter]MCZ2823572.1 hypothetical protein [Modestobacter sp. VKM Ac-2981]MCZ2851817.1 hypothetical protein [Modestobacter sp. VKM Ac-2982]